MLFADWVPILKRLAVIALAAVLIRFRRYEIFGGQWLVPSLMSSLSAFGAAIGLIALSRESSVRKFVWPLKLILLGGLIAGIVTTPPWSLSWLPYTFPLWWVLLVPSSTWDQSVGSSYWRLVLVFSACLESLGLIPTVSIFGFPFHFGVVIVIAAADLLVIDLSRELRVFGRLGPVIQSQRANAVLLPMALLLGSLAGLHAWDYSRDYVRLDLPGSRLNRVDEQNAAYYRFLAANVRQSSDCMFGRFGLDSLYFWAEQPPATTIVPISSLRSQADPATDDRLLRAHRDRLRMMYIDNPDRWKRPPPKSAFLDFVREHFRPLAQVGATRLLVRKSTRPRTV